MGDVVAVTREIDPKQVTRLAAYFREEIFEVELDDGRRWSVARDEYYQLVRELEADESRRLTAAPAGRYDAVWRVEARDGETAAPEVVDGGQVWTR